MFGTRGSNKDFSSSEGSNVEAGAINIDQNGTGGEDRGVME